jgi:hypothetical protein
MENIPCRKFKKMYFIYLEVAVCPDRDSGYL